MSAERFSLSEFSEYLDDSEGHRLAQFLQKKNGEPRPGGRRIFNADRERFSLKGVRLKRISTPSIPPKEVVKDKSVENNNSKRSEKILPPNEIKEDDLPKSSANTTTSHTIVEPPNPETVCDPNTVNNDSIPVPEQRNNTEMVAHNTPSLNPAVQKTPPPLQSNIIAWVPRELIADNERQSIPPTGQQPSSPPVNCGEAPSPLVSPLPSASLPVTPLSLKHLSPRSPMSNVARSGGASNADRLRRQVLKRRSTLANSGKRTLLKEFERTIKSSDFEPHICSTPMSHRPTDNLPDDNLPTGSQKAAEDLQHPASMISLSEQGQALMRTFIAEAVETSMNKIKTITERMQISITPEKSVSEPRNSKRRNRQTITTPMDIGNATESPETQNLLQNAMAQTSAIPQANTCQVPNTQELLQEVQNVLNDFRKSQQAQPPKIVIPVNQTFNSAPTSTKKSDVRECDMSCERTLTNTMLQNNGVNKPHDTLTPTRASCIYPDIQSIVESTRPNVSHCENSHAFINHPTFTHSNNTNAQTPIEHNGTQGQHNRSYTNKVAETFRVRTQNSECRSSGAHSLIQHPTFSVETQQRSVHSGTCMEPQQGCASCNSRIETSTQHECHSPRHSVVEDVAKSNQAQVSAHTSNQQESCLRHNSINTNEVGTPCGTVHTQHERRTTDPSIIPNEAEPMETGAANDSHSRIKQQQNTATNRNNSYTNKVAKACCSPRQSMQQDPRMDSHTQLQHSIRHNSTHTNKNVEMFRECRTPNDHTIIQDSNNQPNNSRKSISFIDKPIFCAANSPASNKNNQSLANDVHPRRSILKNKNMSQANRSNNVTINEHINVANSALITEDEDDDVTESRISNAKRRVKRKSGPLNLAPERRVQTRSRLRRKCRLPTSNVVTSPILTSDTDADTGLPPAHPLNLRHTRHGGEHILQQQQSKRPLNKPPNTPKNGEKFAEELKAHLARLTNHEILDLRKRNSIGEALAAPTRLRKSAVSIERALQQKLQIEEQIQMEILRRELLGQAEGLHEIIEPNEAPIIDNVVDKNLDDTDILKEMNVQQELTELPSAPDLFKDTIATSQRQQELTKLPSAPDIFKDTIATSQRQQELTELPSAPDIFKDSIATSQRDQMILNSSLTENDKNLDDIGILEEMNVLQVQQELTELPSAPDLFKDSIAISQREQMILNVTNGMRSYHSSLIDDNSTERVTFIQPNNSSPQVRKSRSRKRKSEELPEITKKYIDIQKKIKKRRKINVSKRSLYSKGDSPAHCDGSEANTSSEKENCSQASASIQPIPPPPSLTPTRRLTNLHILSPPPPLTKSPTPNRGRPSPLRSPIFVTPSAGTEPLAQRQLVFSSTSSREVSPLPPPASFASRTPRRETSTPPPPSSPSLRDFVLPPAPFLDSCGNKSSTSVNTMIPTSNIKPSSNSTQVAGCQTDDELFKKPTMPAPRRRTQKRKVSERIEPTRQIESSETESSDDAAGVRRSKRGQVPRKESFLCGTQNGPPFLFSLLEAVEKKANKARLKRLEQSRLSRSLNRDISAPIATSTVNKGRKKRVNRPNKGVINEEQEEYIFSCLGDTNTTSDTITNSKNVNCNSVMGQPLQSIEETSTECEEGLAPSENENVVEAQAENEVGNNKASSSRPKPVTVKKNKTQTRKAKAKEKGIPVEASKAAAKETVANVTEDITDAQLKNDKSTRDRPSPLPREKLNEMFDKLKESESESAAITTQSEASTEVTHNEATGSKSESKAGHKNKIKRQKRKEKAIATQSHPSANAPEANDKLKESESESAAITTQSEASTEVTHNEATGSKSKSKAGHKNKIKRQKRKEKATATQSHPSANAPEANAQAIILEEHNRCSEPENELPMTNTQSMMSTHADVINYEASGSRSKAEAVKDNKKQKRKVKATEAQVPTQQNTSTAKHAVVTNAEENITASSQSANVTVATNRTGLLERSHCNGPPPPPRDKLNQMFDQLKKAANNQPPIDEESSSASSSSSTSHTRNVRVRLRRTNLRTAATTSSAESDISTPSSTASSRTQNAQNELYAWLRNVSYSAECSNTPEAAIYREMQASTAGNLCFADLDGIDCAFYNTNDKSSLGYLRFQPLQNKPRKRARKYNLHFVVLAGTFEVATDNENGIFGLGDMVAINIGQRYNIKNMENDIGILMVIKK